MVIRLSFYLFYNAMIRIRILKFLQYVFDSLESMLLGGRRWIQRLIDYHEATRQGNARAQNELGECYYCGDGVEEDVQKAVHWFQQSAEQGFAAAQNNLGECYYYGKGVAKDYMQALHWLQKAAEQGNAAAQFNLGNCYYEGKCVKQDLERAEHWYQESAKQGYFPATLSLLAYYDSHSARPTSPVPPHSPSRQ